MNWLALMFGAAHRSVMEKVQAEDGPPQDAERILGVKEYSIPQAG